MFRVFAALVFATILLAAPSAQARSELESKTLALDIAISVYQELKALAASEGLDVSGDAPALRDRLYRHFALDPPEGPRPDSTLLIERAEGIQTLNLQDSSSTDLLRFDGPARLTVATDDGFSHRLEADLIIYDRIGNVVDASGNVRYTRSSSDRNDSFRGSRIIVDLDQYSGVFIDGAYDLEPEEAKARTLLFRFSNLTTRGEDLRVLENPIVTACDLDPPHYHIDADKAWLFGNGDWALTSATLYVGVIPVLWLPFFYYPGQELLFHPVVGFKVREGAFLQTTTYLIGSKKTEDKDTNLLSMLQNTKSGEGIPSGMFIKKIESPRDQEVAGGDLSRLAIRADLYSSLGLYVGLAGSFPGKNLSTLDFEFGMGASRSIFLQSTGYYSPFDYSGDYRSIWNSADIAGIKLPFRYGGGFKYSGKASRTGLAYGIALDIPFQSDPYFGQDFLQRAESMTLLSILDDNEDQVTTRSTFTQSVTGNLSWSASDSKSPRFFARASISRLNSQLTWRSKAQDSSGLSIVERRLLSADPMREFFFPDSLGIVDFGGAVSGDFLRYTQPVSDTANSSALSRANAGWSLTGQFTMDEKFDSSRWKYPVDVDGSLLYLLYRIKGVLSLQADSGFFGNVLALQAKTSLSAQNQRRPILSDTRTAPTVPHPYLLSDYAYTSATWDASGTASVFPLKKITPLAASSATYSFGASLGRLRYEGLDGLGALAKPVYATTWAGWDNQSITSHQATATLAHAIAKGLSQSLAFSVLLPPLEESYSANYRFISPYFEGQILATFQPSDPDGELEPTALSGKARVGGGVFPVATTELTWDFDERSPRTSVSSLSYKGARLTYTAKRAKAYTFVSNAWVAAGDEQFRPYEASLLLATTIENAKSDDTSGQETNTWPGLDWNLPTAKVSLKPSLTYTQNFLRFTESILTASANLSVSTEKGTTFGFSGSTANKSMWRYWPEVFPSGSGLDPAAYRRYLFKDLADSLAVWDQDKLRASLFKLQSLKVSIAQDLHDWNISAELGVSPYKIEPVGDRAYYKLDVAFSFLVSWKDIPELKTSASYAKGQFSQ